MNEVVMGAQYEEDSIPDFLVKTTFGCSVVISLILLPFTFNNFVQDRFVMGLATMFVIFSCLVNIWYGLRGKYSLWLNSYLVSPAGTLTIAYAVLKLAAPASYWPFLLITAYYFVLPERRAWIFNAVATVIFIPLIWYVLDQPAAMRFSAVAIGISLFAVISMREIYVLHELLKKEAMTDKLTGLFNRYKLDSFLRRAIAQSRRTGMPMSLLTFDLDHFKSINDSLGHQVGDQVLERLAETMRMRVRSSDTPFRIGGDEFLILLNNADKEQGAKVANDLRVALEEADLAAGQKVTISVGVSCLEEGMDMNSWMKDCDEKLYRAKSSGRNRVEV